MRISLLFLMSFCACSAAGQLRESYDDGNFDRAPEWKGNQASFFVNDEKQLQTVSSTTPEVVYLSTPGLLTSATATWEFFIRLAFSPSANNQARIYLSSDQEDLTGALNGYFIQIGETGNDDSYDLFRQAGETITRILDGKDQPRSNVNLLTARIKVVHDADGLWKISNDNTGGTDFELSGSAPDKQFSPGRWFGIYTKYTTTNSGKFIFDDFDISETGGVPAYVAQQNDIVINEIFADPSPVKGLPGKEFIELLNTTDTALDLYGWTFSDANTSAVFSPLIVLPGETVTVCSKADTADFKKYGKVVGLSPWPSLNNAGELLVIKNDRGNLINQVSFKDSWYGDALKKDGGWSLELIDPDALCMGRLNWAAATDPEGGTPGGKNSVYKAFVPEPLKLVSAVITDSLTVRLTFNRPVDTVSVVNIGNYSLNNGQGMAVLSVPSAPDFMTADVRWREPLARGLSYKLTIRGITDCMGNALAAEPFNIELFYPGRINRNDLLISEILFNPRPGGADFVEIYNASGQPLDLKELSIANPASRDSVPGGKPVSKETTLILPGGYFALTTDPGNLTKEYTVKDTLALLKMPSLPSFNDDGGAVAIISGGKVIDQFVYSEKMHFALVKNVEGVSLERSDFRREAGASGNFRSAAGAAGFATPGYRNSQYRDTVSSAEEVFLTANTFSPDNDGFEDELVINYQFNEPGKVANAAIYSDKGLLICKFIKNITLPARGTFTWNGLNNADQKQPVGIYVLVMQVFDLEGNAHRYRRNFVLAGKLN